MTVQLMEKIDRFEREEIKKLEKHPREKDLLAPRIREVAKSLLRSIILMQQNGTSLPQITRIINKNINDERGKLREIFDLYKSQVEESHRASNIIDQLFTEPRAVREPIKPPARTSLQASFEASLNERIAHNMATARAMSTVAEAVGTVVGKTLSLVPFAEKIGEGAAYTLRAAKEAGKLIVSPEARQFLRRFMDGENRPLVNELTRRGFSEGDALQYAHDTKVVALAAVTAPPLFKCVKVGAASVSRVLSRNLTPLTETAFGNISEFSSVVENIQAAKMYSPPLSERFVRGITPVTERDLGILSRGAADGRLVNISMQMVDRTLVFKVGYIEVPSQAFSLPRAMNNALKIARTNGASAIEIHSIIVNPKLKNVLLRRYGKYLVPDPKTRNTNFRIPVEIETIN